MHWNSPVKLHAVHLTAFKISGLQSRQRAGAVDRVAKFLGNSNELPATSKSDALGTGGLHKGTEPQTSLVASSEALLPDVGKDSFEAEQTKLRGPGYTDAFQRCQSKLLQTSRDTL